MRRLANDRALVECLGSNGRLFAVRFTWEGAAVRTEAHLLEIAE
jgi:hypothetical protein